VWGAVGPDLGDLSAWTQQLGGRLHLVDADLTDLASLAAVVEASHPDEVYNLAAVSSVREAWGDAVAATEANAVGVLRLLEVLRTAQPLARFFQAASAEMFGNAEEVPQRETTPLRPRSPYAAAKTYAYHIVGSYRDSYGMHASNGILFNHESPRRGTQFVSRKITDGAARCKLGLADELRMGNLDAVRDWGFAGDYVEAMWLMLQQETPDDYVIASGEIHTVRDFCDAAFSRLGLDYERHVVVDPEFLRPVDVNVFHGDPAKAKRVLGWQPRVAFRGLVEMMVDADLERLSKEVSDSDVR
jgi:GDPmannose 4,6-dehydratase